MRIWNHACKPKSSSWHIIGMFRRYKFKFRAKVWMHADHGIGLGQGETTHRLGQVKGSQKLVHSRLTVPTTTLHGR